MDNWLLRLLEFYHLNSEYFALCVIMIIHNSGIIFLIG